jgi:hypothetical protein
MWMDDETRTFLERASLWLSPPRMLLEEDYGVREETDAEFRARLRQRFSERDSLLTLVFTATREAVGRWPRVMWCEALTPANLRIHCEGFGPDELAATHELIRERTPVTLVVEIAP